MRSTRASAAWAGIALATSFLSVTIIGAQPHTTATSDIAQSVTAPSSRLDALTSHHSLVVVKPVIADGAKLTDLRPAEASRTD